MRRIAAGAIITGMSDDLRFESIDEYEHGPVGAYNAPGIAEPPIPIAVAARLPGPAFLIAGNFDVAPDIV